MSQLPCTVRADCPLHRLGRLEWSNSGCRSVSPGAPIHRFFVRLDCEMPSNARTQVFSGSFHVKSERWRRTHPRSKDRSGSSPPRRVDESPEEDTDPATAGFGCCQAHLPSPAPWLDRVPRSISPRLIEGPVTSSQRRRSTRSPVRPRGLRRRQGALPNRSASTPPATNSSPFRYALNS